MTIQEAILARHAVRSYTDQKIPEDVVSRLKAEIDACNEQSGLHIQLVTDEPHAFDGMMAHYGKFSGVQNYIALIGPKSSRLEEQAGYYGERAALLAQTLGLNTCWVAMSFSKGAAKKRCTIAAGEKLVCVLALGYGATQGVPHRSKPMEALCRVDGAMPDWFRAGMEAAMLAPTAVNQQKFLITLSGDRAEAKSLGGFYSMVDLGIVRYHFEIGSGRPVG
jgi:nitroreductase